MNKGTYAIVIAWVVLTLTLTLVGASCQKEVPPPIPKETELKIYETFYQVESKYNATYDLVVAFTRTTGATTAYACASSKPELKPICDAGKKYQAFYENKMRPASAKATEAYNAALDAWLAYRANTSPENQTSLQDKIKALIALVDQLRNLFAQGETLAQVAQ